MKVLIIASNEDLHADSVCLAIQARGGEVFRMDSEEFLLAVSEFSFKVGAEGVAMQLRYKDRHLDLSDVAAVYCRDYVPLKCSEDSDISTQLIYAESNASYWGLFRCLESMYWMNPPWADEMADNKLYQVFCARSAGLAVPDSVVTNSKQGVVNFFNECNGKIVIKQISPYTLIDYGEEEANGEVYGFYTELVRREHLECLDDVRAAPVLLQRFIEKKYDIRVTIVGSEVFAVKIDSQSCEASKVDFRHVEMLPMEKYLLPGSISRKLLSLLKRWNIEFAACDFVEDYNGDIFFIEANVEGNWLWMESVLDNMRISDCIAVKLLAESKRRRA